MKKECGPARPLGERAAWLMPMPAGLHRELFYFLRVVFFARAWGQVD